MSDAAYSTVLASHHRYFIAHSLIYISLIHKNGSKWVLSGHTISPCGAVLKNGSKWVLSGHTNGSLREREGERGERERELYPHLSHLDQAKFLTHSKMGLNGYFQRVITDIHSSFSDLYFSHTKLNGHMNSLVTMTLVNFHIVSGITKAVP